VHLRVDGLQADGKMRVSIVEGDLEPPPVPDGGPPVVRPRPPEKDPHDAGLADGGLALSDGGGDDGCACDAASAAGAPWLALLLALPLRRRRR
jgi:MYXO-CTERM domain-containing protein